MHLNIQNE